MQPSDLLASASLLIEASKGKPSQVNLRRAVSSTYYALFHALARNCADMLIGGQGAQKSKHAWIEVYRSLGHGTAKSACEHKEVIVKFPLAIADFSSKFIEMQRKRHAADYDPSARFYKSDVISDVAATEIVISSFNVAPTKDKRAFASWVLFKNMKRN